MICLQWLQQGAQAFVYFLFVHFCFRFCLLYIFVCMYIFLFYWCYHFWWITMCILTHITTGGTDGFKWQCSASCHLLKSAVYSRLCINCVSNIIADLISPYSQSRSLRSFMQKLLSVPPHNLDTAARLFLCCCSKTLETAPSVDTFKIRLKTFLFVSA